MNNNKYAKGDWHECNVLKDKNDVIIGQRMFRKQDGEGSKFEAPTKGMH